MIITYQKILKGKKVGIVFGTFAPMHQGHLDVIMRAKKECDGGCIVIVDGRKNDRGDKMGMPLKKRYRYIREFFADDDLVAVYPIDEDEFGIPEYPNGWGGFLSVTLDIFDKGTENYADPVFYVSEPAYWSKLTEEGLEAICLDRTENPISATMIRENPLKYWDQITYPFRRVFSKNILICGTASEGKTTLVKDLGKYFNAPYATEYAREYMEQSYVSEWELDGMDYMAFLDGQYRKNRAMINSPANNGVFFADSDSMTTRMYAEYYHRDPELDLTEEEFKEIAVAADAITKKCRWDKIYVLAPHGVFVDDHTRYMEFSGMQERRELFEILCRNLKESGNWDKVVILTGGYYDNFKKIKNDIKEMYENGSLA